MSNCKQCNNPIESHTGRRAKQFCNDKCRNDFYNAQNKGKNSDKVWRATYEAVLTENKALKLLIKELQEANPITQRNNPFENAARGRDEDGGNRDELRFTKSQHKKARDKVIKSAISYSPATPESFDGSKKETLIDEPPNWPATHPLWKEEDPKENSMAFHLKYGVFTYEELSKT